jgi:hypothetical protein
MIDLLSVCIPFFALPHKAHHHRGLTGCTCTASACCRACNPEFDPSYFFLGKLGISEPPPSASTAEKRKHPKLHRPKANSDILKLKLIDWRKSLGNPSHSLVRPASWILDDRAINTLARAHPDERASAESATTLLGRSRKFHNQYADALWSVIQQHNIDEPLRRSKKRGCTEYDAKSEAESQYVSSLRNLEQSSRPKTTRQRQIALNRQALKDTTNTTVS